MRHIPLMLFLCHTAIVLLVAAAVWLLGADGEASMLWGVVMLLDFPVLLLYQHWDFGIEQLPLSLRHTIGYAGYALFFGGLQYYLIGRLFVWLFARRMQSKVAPDRLDAINER